jgi:hypothetical protein
MWDVLCVCVKVEVQLLCVTTVPEWRHALLRYTIYIKIRHILDLDIFGGSADILINAQNTR